jgi:PAS domain S-box-containing protein
MKMNNNYIIFLGGLFLLSMYFYDLPEWFQSYSINVSTKFSAVLLFAVCFVFLFLKRIYPNKHIISKKVEKLEYEKKIINSSNPNHPNLINSFIDITTYQKTEIHIRKLSVAIEQNPTTIVITDIAGNIEYANPKFTELTGYSFDEVKGLNSSKLKSGKTDSKVYRELWRTILSGEVWKGEFINKKKNGDEFIESAIISPIFDDSGEIINFLAIYEDITEKRNSEKKIREQQTQLEKSFHDLEFAKKKAEDSMAEIEKLNEFTRKINSSLSTSAILKEIYSYIYNRTGFDLIWILLVNKKKGQIFSDSNLSVFNSAENLDISFFREFKMKLNESLGVLFKTYQTRIPFYTLDAMNSKRSITNLFDDRKIRLRNIDFEIQRKGNFQSMLQIPLVLQNEVIGILNLTAHRKLVDIQNEDIRYLMRFADQIAGVIFNAHLMEELQEAKQDAEISEKIAVMAQKEMEQEKRKSDQLLLNILPGEIAKELREKGAISPVQYQSVSVMFTDFKGFTKIAETMTPTELIDELDICFSYFDSLMDRFNLEKLKTIGDSYMCAGGIPIENKTHPVDTILAALEIQAVMFEAKKLRQSLNLPFWELRLGIHTGPLIAGVIGEKKFAYDVWGDTVNIASRMESSGTPEMVNISKATYDLVKDFFHCEYRGEIQAKNKGFVEMYYVMGIRKELCVEDEPRVPSFRFWILYDRLKKGEPLNLKNLKDRRVGLRDERNVFKERRRNSKNSLPVQNRETNEEILN